MGVCNIASSRQDLGPGNCEMIENDMTTFKISGKDEYGQSLVISSRQLNIEDDPSKQFLYLYYEKHKLEIDTKFLEYYLEILKPGGENIVDISLKMHDIPKKQAKFLSCILPYCPELRKLNLWETMLCDSGLRYLTKCFPKIKNLEELSLEQNNIREEGFVYFSKGLRHLHKLKVLSIGNNIIGLEGIKSLCVALENCPLLEKIYMHNNDIDTEMFKIFVIYAEGARNLYTLGVGYNKLDKSSLEYIRKFLNFGRITEIYLKGNQIEDDDADCLVAEFISINIDI